MAVDPPSAPRPGTSPPWDYPWEEWSEALLSTSGAADAHEFRPWFDARYPDLKERRWKFVRFASAFSYLLMHEGEFEEFGVKGTPESANGWMYSPHLKTALWACYHAAPDAALYLEPSIKQVLDLARQSAASH